MFSKERYSSIFDQRPLTVKQTMEYLQISRSTLTRWQQAGLKHCKIGNEIRFWRHDLDLWIEQHSVEQNRIDHG